MNNASTFKMHRDIATTNDLLGFRQFTNPIAHKIATTNIKSTPLTIGIYGQWGSGKTSFLLMIDEALREDKIYPIWFNAWKYEQEDNLWAALLQTILDQATVNGSLFKRAWIKITIWWHNISFYEGLWEVAKKVLPVIIRLTLFLFFAFIAVGSSRKEIQTFLGQYSKYFLNYPILINILAAAFGVFAAKPDAILKLFSSNLGIDYSKFSCKHNYKEHIAFLDEFNSELKQIISMISGSKPLVIIIDDLDRCLPEKAIQVLEAMKLFLDIEGCIFLIAVDREVVENSISFKYKDIIARACQVNGQENGSIANLAESYFEKLIHLPFSLPPLSNSDSIRYINSLYETPGIQNCSEIFALGLPNNPRKIKRVLNLYLFLQKLAEGSINNGDIKTSLLSKMVIIQNQYRALYNEIIELPTLLEYLELIYKGKKSDIESRNDFDPISLERASAFTTIYPKVREILLYSYGDEDTFIGVKLTKYIYFLSTVADIQGKDKDKDEEATVESFVGQYLSIITNEAQHLRTLGGAEIIQLDQSYVPSLFRAHGLSSHDISDSLSIHEMLRKQNRIIIIGPAGSGKTTLIRYISLILGKTFAPNEIETVKNKLGFDKLFLPILISAREYGLFLNEGSGYSHSILLEYINKYLMELNMSVPNKFLINNLEKGKIMLMIDGLDEISDPNKKSSVIKSINDLSSRYPINRFLITSRPINIMENITMLSSFQLYEILPWGTEQINKFIHQSGTLPDKEKLFYDFLNTSGMKDISTNPMLLSLLLTSYRDDPKLPVSRGALFSKIIDWHLSKWEEIKGISDKKIKMNIYGIRKSLSKLALNLLKTDRITFNEQEFIDEITRTTNISEIQDREIVDYIKNRAGLISEVGDGTFAFGHRVIQEYFAASAISEMEVYQEILRDRNKSKWREIIIMGIEMMSDNSQIINYMLNSNDKYFIEILKECLDRGFSIEIDLKDKIKRKLNKIG